MSHINISDILIEMLQTKHGHSLMSKKPVIDSIVKVYSSLPASDSDGKKSIYQILSELCKEMKSQTSKQIVTDVIGMGGKEGDEEEESVQTEMDLGESPQGYILQALIKDVIPKALEELEVEESGRHYQLNETIPVLGSKRLSIVDFLLSFSALD